MRVAIHIADVSVKQIASAPTRSQQDAISMQFVLIVEVEQALLFTVVVVFNAIRYETHLKL